VRNVPRVRGSHAPPKQEAAQHGFLASKSTRHHLVLAASDQNNVNGNNRLVEGGGPFSLAECIVPDLIRGYQRNGSVMACYVAVKRLWGHTSSSALEFGRLRVANSPLVLGGWRRRWMFQDTYVPSAGGPYRHVDEPPKGFYPETPKTLRGCETYAKIEDRARIWCWANGARKLSSFRAR